MDADPQAALTDYLALADWRRRVAAAWERWRRDAAVDPAAATATFRAGKDELFREHPQSPLPRERIAPFQGLPYWPYDPAWRMTVGFDADAPPSAGPHDDPSSSGVAGTPVGRALPNSGSAGPTFRRVGRVALTGPLAGQHLAVFWLEGYGGGLFVPFRDATAGSETYGAGRYLVDGIKGADPGGDPAARMLVLDFNMAYHPSCAYDPRWACPLAPPENRLTMPVRVGERLA